MEKRVYNWRNPETGKEKKGFLYWVAWTGGGIIVCTLIAIGIATVQVLLFEKTESGRYAVYNQCIEVDKDCVNSCIPEQGDDCNCCLRRDNKVVPIGNRIEDLMIRYTFASILAGAFVGNVIGDVRRKKVPVNIQYKDKV